ncbi:TolC family protein [Desulfosarcina cetonica]|uniref:TolC family protein n=1 Tax=Desulfosarcina cetonica TaxID=90730 RepID=UPI00248C8C14|nr:TolC family protein [Desulfosarcina cetonica]
MASPSLEDLIATALDHRSDLKALHWQVQQAEAQVEVARSGYYPSVALSGTVGGDRSGDADFRQDDFGNQVQLGLSYNLFSGGYTRAKIQEARQRKVELEKTLADQRLSTTADIRSAATRVATAQTQVILQRENVDLVQRTRDLVEKEYNAGQGSLVRLNEAQKDLTTARSNLALALVGLRQAWVELRTQAGTLLANLAF